MIRLDELTQFLKECQYPEDVITKVFSMQNFKVRPAPNREKSKNVILFIITYYANIDNKSLMQTVKNKFKNVRNKYLKSTNKEFHTVSERTKKIVQTIGIF